MNRYWITALALAGALLMAGCEANPAIPNLADQLEAELEFAGTHLSTLTEIEVEVRVHVAGGAIFSDLSSIAVEMKREGDTEWRATELSAHADHFSAEMMFFTSGEYDARVVGQITGRPEVLTLYESPDHIHVERIHQKVGDYVVEFETTPGHMHEGGTAEVGFWVFEALASGEGHGDPVTGLAPEIMCTDGDGSMEQHLAEEHEGGEYHAEHTLGEAGTAVFELHFTDGSGVERHAEFSTPVSHQH